MKRIVSLSLKLLISLVAFVGVGWQLGSHGRVLEMVSYFTIQSNLIAALLFAYLFFAELTKKVVPSWMHFLKGGATVALLITFLVYHFILRGAIIELESDYVVLGGPDLFVHYFTPLLVLVDWVFFTKKSSLSKWLPLAVVVQPLLYLVYLAIYRLFGGWFSSFGQGSSVPYFFLDVETLGWGTVLLYCGGLSIVIALLGGFLLLIEIGKEKLSKKR